MKGQVYSMFMRPLHFIFALLVTLIWGVNFAASKIAVEHFPPFLLTGLRFTLVFLVTLPFLFSVPKDQIRPLILTSFIMAVHFLLCFLGYHWAIDVSSQTIVMQLYVPFSAILGLIFLRESLTLLKVLALVVAGIGMCIIAYDPVVFKAPLGAITTACAALMMAIGTLWMKKLKGVKVYTLQASIAVAAMITMYTLSLIFEDQQIMLIETAPMPALFGLFFTAIFSSLVAHGLNYFLLQTYPITTIAPFYLLTPIFGIAGGVILKGDHVSNKLIYGAVLVIGAIMLIYLPMLIKTKRN